MNADARRWERIKKAFQAARDAEPGRRDDVLTEHCGSDEVLRREVEELLGAEEGADQFLGAVARKAGLLFSDVMPAPSLVGRRFGAYRLLRLIGQGGMGVVYLAERDDHQFEKQVAVKLLPVGLSTGAARERFLAERQILAQLEHPDIARLLDAGIADDGTPYFVMEYIDGEPIDRYCDRSDLGITERIDLFLRVCGAVEYAHRNLVVHRDLKPGNILVTADGTVKLLDFGIAKVIDSASPGVATALTHGGGRPMTPAYASPEQVRGEPITTATDVYALGVLLYELLVGRPPYAVQGLSASDLERLVCTQEPVAPSAALERAAGAGEGNRTASTAAAGRARRLRGDLDTIVLKALRKEPERRYRSAASLADDIVRHREGRPVEAQPNRLGYRAGKFARRRPGLVAAAAVGLLALVGFTATLLMYAERAEGERIAAEAERDRATLETERAEAVTTFLLDLFDVAGEGGALDTITAGTLLRAGEARLRERLDPHPEVRIDLLQALAEAHGRLGIVGAQDRILEERIEVLKDYLSPEDMAVARALRELGGLRSGARQWIGAERALQQSLSIQLAHAAATRPARDDRVLMASTIGGLAIPLRHLGQTDSAVIVARKAMRHQQELAVADSALLFDAASLAYALRGDGQVEEAELLFREVLAALDEEGADRPALRAQVLNNLASLLRAEERPEEAESRFRESRTILRLVSGPESLFPEQVGQNLMHLLIAQGRLLEAAALADSIREEIVLSYPPGHWRVGRAHHHAGVVWLESADCARGLPALETSARIYGESLGTDHPWTGGARALIAECTFALGDLARAEALLVGAIPAMAAASQPNVARIEVALGVLADVYTATGRTAQAERLRRDGMAAEARLTPLP